MTLCPRPSLLVLAAEVAACRRCQAAGHLAEAAPRLLGLEARLVPGGLPPPRLLIVGQAPSRQAGMRAFADSPYGRALATWLARAGFATDDLVQTAHFTAITRCFPGPGVGGRGDRAPSPAEVALCAPYLKAEWVLLRPSVVLAVGALAIRVLGGPRGPLGAAVGTIWERDGARCLALPHPSGVSRWHNDPANHARLNAALAHLAAWRDEMPGAEGRVPPGCMD